MYKLAAPRSHHYLAPVSQYNTRLLRQKAGGACLHMPKSGYLPASFEVIPLQKVALPRPRRWKFKFPSMPKNIVTLTLTALKFQSAKLAFFSAGAKKSSLQSRLSWQQTIFYPTEIRSRPIDCDPRYGKNKMFFSVIFGQTQKHVFWVFLSQPVFFSAAGAGRPAAVRRPTPAGCRRSVGVWLMCLCG